MELPGSPSIGTLSRISDAGKNAFRLMSMPARSEAPKKRSSGPIPITRERALMDRARLNAELDHDKPRRPVWVTVIGVLLAISVVAIVGRGFDAFLGGFQRLLERMAQQEAEAEIRKPQPIFVVPEEQPAAPPGGDGTPPDE
jgi:hypothetical protein